MVDIDLPFLRELKKPLFDSKSWLAAYRRYLVAFFRKNLEQELDVCARACKSGPSSEKNPQPENSYVPLDTTTRIPKKLREDEDHPLPVLEAASRNRRLVILGAPGSGKSTFLNYLGLRLVQASLENKQNAPKDFQVAKAVLDQAKWPEKERGLFPIYVALREFAQRDISAADTKTLWMFIEESLKSALDSENIRNIDGIINEIRTLLEANQVIMLLDGLDEIDNEDKRRQVRDAVNHFATSSSGCRCIVTCRVLPYEDMNLKLSGFPPHTLAPFDEDKIIQFVNKWYRCDELDDEQDESEETEKAKGNRDNLLKAIENSRKENPEKGIGKLGETPLLLTVIAMVQDRGNGTLPDTRAELYQEAVRTLLFAWDEKKRESGLKKKSDSGHDVPLRTLQFCLDELHRDDEKVKKELQKTLGELAYQVHGRMSLDAPEAKAYVSRGDLIVKLERLYSKDYRVVSEAARWASEVIRTTNFRAGLFLDEGNDLYSFPHRTFQEYLAGYYLSVQGIFNKDFVQEAIACAEKGDIWREVLLLSVGYLARVEGNIEKPLAFTEALCPEKKENTEVAWRKAWIAGELLRELDWESVRRYDHKQADELFERVRERLVDLLEARALSPKERVEAGNVLGRLGDPRFGAGNFFLPNDENTGFIAIPGGEFTMGDVDVDVVWRNVTPYRVKLSPYWIGKYPVTVAQFRAFIDAEHGGKWDEEWQKYNTVGNHPVVEVSWHEANEYCQWLTGKLREQAEISPAALPAGWAERLILKDKPWQIALPTEAQWEFAARGKEGRKWPWGEAEIAPDRANYEDTQIGDLSPVGCFLAGNTPEGIADMAGNVWEFCSDWYSNEYYAECKARGIVTDPPGPARGEVRAIRGGGWVGSGWECRPAFRFVWRGQDVRSGGNGFRLVFSQVFSQVR